MSKNKGKKPQKTILDELINSQYEKSLEANGEQQFENYYLPKITSKKNNFNNQQKCNKTGNTIFIIKLLLQ